MKSSYKPDVNWSIGVMVAAGCYGLSGLSMAVMGSLFNSAFADLHTKPGELSNDPTLSVASRIGPVMGVGGMVLFVLSTILFAGGVGMYGGRKRGFVTVAVVSGLGILMGLASLPNGLTLAVLGGAFLYYSVTRLRGGPTPAVQPPPLT